MTRFPGPRAGASVELEPGQKGAPHWGARPRVKPGEAEWAGLAPVGTIGAVRDEWLESRAYKVIRTANREIYTNLSEVLDGIGHGVSLRPNP